MVAVSTSSPYFLGYNPPKYITGAGYSPIGYHTVTGTAINTTVNRCFYTPFTVWEPHTFQGVWTENQGAGDNGEVYRMMVFNDDGASGGPGTLAKDFGEVTLTGAAALRLLTSSWAATPGRYWMAQWHNTAAAMIGMSLWCTAGQEGVPSMQSMIGTIAPTTLVQGELACHTVDTAYGAAPATAVAPTVSRFQALGGITPAVPVWALKA